MTNYVIHTNTFTTLTFHIKCYCYILLHLVDVDGGQGTKLKIYFGGKMTAHLKSTGLVF